MGACCCQQTTDKDQHNEESLSASESNSQHSQNRSKKYGIIQAIDDAPDPNIIQQESLNVTFNQPEKYKIRSDWKQGLNIVAILSGGGYGHYPAHPGYVGKGGLAAAITGKYFEAPKAKLIIEAIEAVTGKMSDSQVLLIVKNYEQDKEEFAKAATICKNKYNMAIEMVVVKDNCDADESGVAGTILVHKVAGYLSERNKSLKEITHYLNSYILPHIASIGIAKINSKKFELGIGIHAEPSNLANVECAPVNKLMQPMFEQIWKKWSSDDQKADISTKLISKSADRIIVLLNNLGGQESIYKDYDLMKIMGHILDYIQEQMKNLSVQRVFYGTYMTSTGEKGIKNGFSVTILKIIDDTVLDALDSVVDLDDKDAWIGGLSVGEFKKRFKQKRNEQKRNEQINDISNINNYPDDDSIGTITTYEHSHLPSDQQLEKNIDNAIGKKHSQYQP